MQAVMNRALTSSLHHDPAIDEQLIQDGIEIVPRDITSRCACRVVGEHAGREMLFRSVPGFYVAASFA
jgi:hypothetical protein